MTLIRVRLLFDRPVLDALKQCWMLLDTATCKFVHDLEYLIVKKFFVGGHNILNLYLDDFLLPSHEKIEVIRENDIITVKEDETPSLKKENEKKRKFEESNNDSKKKSKKMRHSLDKSKEKQNNVTEKQSNHSNKPEAPSTKTSLKSFNNKSKSKRAAKFLHKVFKDKRKVGSDKTTCTIDSKTQKKHATKELKEKNKSNNLEIDKKGNSTSSNKKQIAASVDSLQTKEVSKNELPVSAPVRVGKGGTTTNEKLKSDEVVGGNHGCKGVINNTKQKDKVKEDRMSSAFLSSRNYSFTSAVASSSGSSSSSSSDSEGAINMVKTNTGTLNDLTVSKTNQRQKLELNTVTRHGNGTVPPVGQRINDIPQSQGNHIRFDNDEVDSIVKTQVTPSLSCPDISPVCPATSCTNGTPYLSPIQPNLKTYNVQRASDTRKDIYTNKSNLMESTRMEKETQEPHPIPNSIPEKDFSKYQLLRGPPRVGETVAYKVIELSQSYTPEISKYKEGKVLAFDPVSNELKLKLTKESLSRATGDGHISYKFELFDVTEEEEESGEPILPVEIPDEVEVQWSSMIEPRLVIEPETTQ